MPNDRVKPFLFVCPATRLTVQGLSMFDKESATDPDRYELIECLACADSHLVNPTSGHVKGTPRPPEF